MLESPISSSFFTFSSFIPSLAFEDLLDLVRFCNVKVALTICKFTLFLCYYLKECELSSLFSSSLSILERLEFKEESMVLFILFEFY